MTYNVDNFEFDWQHETGVSMADVGGMEDLKEQLMKEVIRPLTTDRKKAEQLGITVPNILFYGPPGTGKTYLVKALATELGLPFVKLSGSDIKSKWINQSAQQTQQLFDEAKMQAKQEGGALVFIDELDSVLPKRSNGTQHGEDTKVVNEFLNHLEDTSEYGVVFVGATNRLEHMDEAATRSGRIDRKIQIGLPDASAREKILKAQLKPRAYKIANDNLQIIAENADGYSAAELEGTVQDAARNAAFERNADVITLQDIGAVTNDLIAGTDSELSANESIPDSSPNRGNSRKNRRDQPIEFESQYRIVGFADEARRMALYDLPRDDTVWVNTIGYEDDIRSVLENAESGNVVEATVTDRGDENEYWNLVDINIVDDSVLYFAPTDGYAPGPTDGIWEQRNEGADIVTGGRRHRKTDELLYEIQLQANTVETDDGEVLDVYENLQRGELLTEPFFEGNGCDHLPDGAEAVIIVNPKDKPYIVIYLFSEKATKFDEIWGKLFDYVEDT
jgi:transitional endoplasmic reticulum ATPase